MEFRDKVEKNVSFNALTKNKTYMQLFLRKMFEN